MLVGHLFVDGVQRFLAPSDAYWHLGIGKNGLDFLLHFLNQVAAAAARLGHGLGKYCVAPRAQMAERQVLQLAIGLVQAQAVGDRCVDLQRLGGNAAPFGARHIRQGPHVVRTVSQFDQDHAHIARHRQQHLAERFGLVFFAGIEVQLVQLGQAVHQLCYRRAKFLN